jgi:uncharacterized protein YndB with AHSA1/START domain
VDNERSDEVTGSKSEKIAGVGNAAVRLRTGKSWEEWFEILDEAGAKDMKHKDIAAYLRKHHIESAWWSQMVTVGYEQSRGLREKHEKPTGFEVGRSKTVSVPVADLYDAWKDSRIRRKWLGESGLQIRTAAQNKSMRLTWSDGETVVAVYFHDKGREKSQVSVQHTKLKNKTAGEKMKKYWGDALDRLSDSLKK